MRVVVLFVAGLAGCEPEVPADTADGCAEAEPLTWSNFGHGFVLDYCTTCHSARAPERYGAPAGLNFDTLEEVRAQSAMIRDAVLVRGEMPLGNGVDERTLADLDTFLACGL